MASHKYDSAKRGLTTATATRKMTAQTADTAEIDRPSRLDPRQQFVLAWLADYERRHRRSLPFPVEPKRWVLARAVDEEFGAGIDRIEPRTGSRRAGTLSRWIRDLAALVSGGRNADAGRSTAALAATYDPSFTRTIAELEERNLVRTLVRERPDRSTGRFELTYRECATDAPETHVGLTDRGRAVGEELLDRHRDRRFDLAFRTLEKE